MLKKNPVTRATIEVLEEDRVDGHKAPPILVRQALTLGQVTVLHLDAADYPQTLEEPIYHPSETDSPKTSWLSRVGKRKRQSPRSIGGGESTNFGKRSAALYPLRWINSMHMQ